MSISNHNYTKFFKPDIQFQKLGALILKENFKC